MSMFTGTTNVFSVGTAGGLREDLEDVIHDLFAEDTKMLTSLDRVDANGVYHEWLLDSLAAAAANTQLEGDEFGATTAAAPTRVGNYCQISAKNFVVSGTLEAVSKAGRAKEAARLAMKRMRELKNDMELAIVGNQASTAGAAASARSSAGMESWIATNYAKTTTTSGSTTVGFSSGTVAAPTDGTTLAAMTIGSLNAALAGAWSSGGKPTMLLCAVTAKGQLDAITGIAQRTIDLGRKEKASIVNAASVIVTNFGTHEIVLHRHVRSQTLLAIDPEYWAVAYLRRPFSEKMAKTGDADKTAIRTEWTLVARNQASSAKVVSIT